MKRFCQNALSQIGSTYAIMMAVFTLISILNGVEAVPVARLGQLCILSVIGGTLMEIAFGKIVFRRMADAKRVCLFIVPFCVVTLLFALGYGWITRTDALSTYLRFFAIFLACGVLSVILFDIEHHLRGRKYTEKLKAYQQRGKQS